MTSPVAPVAPLAGRVAIVTGAAGGIGAATARRLAAAGAAVAIFDVSDVGARATVDEIRAVGAAATFHHVDLSDLNALPPAVDEVARDHGRIDILVNCAAITGDPDPLGFFELTPETWARVFTVNAQAPFVLMQLVGRLMIDNGRGGRIVNVTSSGAFRARSLPAYSAAKAALGQLTRTAAVQLAPHGVTVNNVAPGLTRTKLVQDRSPDLDAAVKEGPLANLTHRVSEPDDVASAIQFLCLPESRQIVAQTIHTSAGAVV